MSCTKNAWNYDTHTQTHNRQRYDRDVVSVTEAIILNYKVQIPHSKPFLFNLYIICCAPVVSEQLAELVPPDKHIF